MSSWFIWIVLALIVAGWLFLMYRFPAGSRGRTRLKWAFRAVIALAVFAFLHYTLPQHDIVRITNTYNRLTTIGENRIFYASPDVGTQDGAETRDIRFIETIFDNGRVMVYRNEDTGWVWPPYFKYDSSNLQAQASNLKSTEADPRWVRVTHYGWRAPWLSIYPNAVKVKQVDGPDVTVIPWVSISILVALGLILMMIRRMWLQFRERTIDPAVEDVGEVLTELDARADSARAEVRGTWGRLTAWLESWRKKP